MWREVMDLKMNERWVQRCYFFVFSLSLSRLERWFLVFGILCSIVPCWPTFRHRNRNRSLIGKVLLRLRRSCCLVPVVRSCRFRRLRILGGLVVVALFRWGERELYTVEPRYSVFVNKVCLLKLNVIRWDVLRLTWWWFRIQLEGSLSRSLRL